MYILFTRCILYAVIVILEDFIFMNSGKLSHAAIVTIKVHTVFSWAPLK